MRNDKKYTLAHGLLLGTIESDLQAKEQDEKNNKDTPNNDVRW